MMHVYVLFSTKNIFYKKTYPGRGASNEYPKHVFAETRDAWNEWLQYTCSGRNKKKYFAWYMYPFFYLELWLCLYETDRIL